MVKNHQESFKLSQEKKLFKKFCEGEELEVAKAAIPPRAPPLFGHAKSMCAEGLRRSN